MKSAAQELYVVWAPYHQIGSHVKDPGLMNLITPLDECKIKKEDLFPIEVKFVKNKPINFKKTSVIVTQISSETRRDRPMMSQDL